MTRSYTSCCVSFEDNPKRALWNLHVRSVQSIPETFLCSFCLGFSSNATNLCTVLPKSKNFHKPPDSSHAQASASKMAQLGAMAPSDSPAVGIIPGLVLLKRNTSRTYAVDRLARTHEKRTHGPCRMPASRCTSKSDGFSLKARCI